MTKENPKGLLRLATAPFCSKTGFGNCLGRLVLLFSCVCEIHPLVWGYSDTSGGRVSGIIGLVLEDGIKYGLLLQKLFHLLVRGQVKVERSQGFVIGLSLIHI